jgi:tripartite-type tricarboxylate transporter receptor subunit TctC
MKRRRLLLGSLAAAAPFSPARAQAAWPGKPVRFVVPFAPGGGTDTVSRLICDHLGKTFGQSFVVDNKGGAGGNIGTVEIAKGAPDGYTIGLISVASHTLNPMLYSRLPYDPDKDILAIARVALLANLLGVTKSLPVNNVAELVALCKKEPGKYSFASSGPGTSLHLSGELFKAMAGVDIVHIPYKGSSQARTDTLGGQVDMMFDAVPTMSEFARAGKVRALATSGKVRSSVLPEVPTLAEAGVPGYEAVLWLGIIAPKGTPPEVVRRLNTEITKITTNPGVRDEWARQGAVAMAMTPEEFGRYLTDDIAKWERIVMISGAKPDK